VFQSSEWCLMKIRKLDGTYQDRKREHIQDQLIRDRARVRLAWAFHETVARWISQMKKIREFIEAWKGDFGETLSPEAARGKINRLVIFFEMLEDLGRHGDVGDF